MQIIAGAAHDSGHLLLNADPHQTLALGVIVSNHGAILSNSNDPGVIG